MSGFRLHLAVLGTVLAVALAGPAAGLTDPSTALAATLTVALTAVLALRFAASIGAALETTIGSRARDHRESIGSQVAPSHPTTPGRPLGRAPTGGAPAA